MTVRAWFSRSVRVTRFVGFYLRELVFANLLVARSVISGVPPIRPAVVRYPMSLRSDLGVTLLANLISLTPGTLTLDVNEDDHVLWVHGLHVESADDLRQHLAGLEHRLQDALS